MNSPPDSLATGDTVRIAGQSPASSGNMGQTGNAASEDVAAAPESKPH